MATPSQARIARELDPRTGAQASRADCSVGVTMQPYHVVEAQYRGGFVVWLRFYDGTAGEIDLGPELWGEVFEPLRVPEVFKQFKIDPLFHTLVWPNGADLAQEFLHDNIRVTA